MERTTVCGMYGQSLLLSVLQKLHEHVETRPKGTCSRVSSRGRPAVDNPHEERPTPLLTSQRNPSYSHILDPRAGPPSVWESLPPVPEAKGKGQRRAPLTVRGQKPTPGATGAAAVQQTTPHRARLRGEESAPPNITVPQANGVLGTRRGHPLKSESRPQLHQLKPTLHIPLFNFPLPGDLSW